MSAHKNDCLSQSSDQPQRVSSAQSSTGSQAHSHPRSIPAGMDERKYLSYPNTSESFEYTSTPTNTCSSSTPLVDPTRSPLGLADIRPFADQEKGDNPSIVDFYSHDEELAVPTNSKYLAPWPIYAFAWCKWPVQQDVSENGGGKMAIGSFIEHGHNFIQILDTYAQPMADVDGAESEYSLEYTKLAEAQHAYPVTKILWEPPSSQKESTNLFASSGDHLRLWSLPSQPPHYGGNSITSSSKHVQPKPQNMTPLALLSSSKSTKNTAPLTSLDWNRVSPSLMITSSIDTTCTLWDIPTLKATTQLIAHDQEVYDVQFCANSVDAFLSCGADGSVRMFDQRSLEHSTIIYDPSVTNAKSFNPTNMSLATAPPLLRLAASPHDTHLLATFSQEVKNILILDIRRPGQTVLELQGHDGSINCIEWSHSKRGTLASGGDDCLVFIWDLLNQVNATSTSGLQTTSSSENFQGPNAGWQCDYEVNNLSWAPKSALADDGNEAIGVTGGRGVWGVCM